MQLEGATFGDYRLVELIGQGGMGAVYRARHHTLPRDAAVKVRTASAQQQDEEEIRRFRREALYMAQLSHPNLVKIFDAGLDGETLWIAMELLPGKTMGDHLQDHKRVPVLRACAWIREACRGLQALHDAGITHRDIKPDNIMITREGAVKVMDLGLAREATATVLTAAGDVVGTPAFLAPESLRSANTDHRVDVYQIGVVLYLLVTGELPWQTETMSDYMKAVLTQPPTPPRTYLPGIPEALERVLDRALAKDPGARIATAAALADALQAVIDEQEGRPRPRTTGARAALARTPGPRSAPPRRVAYPLGIALAALGGLGAIAAALHRPPPPAPPASAAPRGPDAALLAAAAHRATEALATGGPAIGHALTELSGRLVELAHTSPEAGAPAAVQALAELLDAEEAATISAGGGLPHALADSGALPPLVHALQPFAAVPSPAGGLVALLGMRAAAEQLPGQPRTAIQPALARLRPLIARTDAGDDEHFAAQLAGALALRLAGEPEEALHAAEVALRLVDDNRVNGAHRRMRAAAAVIETGMEAYRLGFPPGADQAHAALAKHRAGLPAGWAPGYRQREPRLAEDLGL